MGNGIKMNAVETYNISGNVNVFGERYNVLLPGFLCVSDLKFCLMPISPMGLQRYCNPIHGVRPQNRFYETIFSMISRNIVSSGISLIILIYGSTFLCMVLLI